MLTAPGENQHGRHPFAKRLSRLSPVALYACAVSLTGPLTSTNTLATNVSPFAEIAMATDVVEDQADDKPREIRDLIERRSRSGKPPSSPNDANPIRPASGTTYAIVIKGGTHVARPMRPTTFQTYPDRINAHGGHAICRCAICRCNVAPANHAAPLVRLLSVAETK